MSGPDPGSTKKLSRAALAFRTLHAVIAVEMLLAIAYVWWCALTGRRGAYHREKLGEDKSYREAMRCLKRRISDAVFSALVADSRRSSLAGA